MIGNNSKTAISAENSKRPAAGFTLVEVLVTIGIFAITLVIVSGIFININNLQQQTAAFERLQNDGRYVLEKIGKEIRGRELDYGSMDLSGGGVASELVFKPDEYGQVLSIAFNETGQSLLFDLAGQSADINSNDVIIEKAAFIVMPATDPYVTEQPRVMVSLVLKNRDLPAAKQKTLRLQTTFSSKTYR